jgi:myo-inositol 2-dehydrogenase/D-chiro-inositol 1-dehydrogenase
MDKVRIGMLGAGIIGGTHSAVLHQICQALPERAELVAIADPLEEPREMFRALYGYREAFADGRAVLEHPDVNTLFVCVPTNRHAQAVHAAATRGLHLFCEKPLAMSHTEGVEMVAAVERAGVKAQIGLVLRYSAVYNVMRSLMLEPQAGSPVAVMFRDDQCFPIRGLHFSAWRADRKQTAGGTLIEHGVHDLDLLTWFFGRPRRLRAWEQNRAGHHGVEDYVAIELEFDGGLRAQLVNLWHDVLQRHSNRRLEIFCQTAFLASSHDMSGTVTCQFGDGEEKRLSEDDVLRRYRNIAAAVPEELSSLAGVAYLMQDLAFIDALLSDRDPHPGMRIGLEAQRLAEAVYHAARTGEEIELAAFRSAS